MTPAPLAPRATLLHAYAAAREAVVAAWFFFGVSYYVSGLYDAGRLYRVGRTLTSAVIAVSAGTLLMMATFYAALSDQVLGRMIFAGYAIFVFAAVLLAGASPLAVAAVSL